MKVQGRTNYLALLSVLSALAVVFIHINACFWEYSTEPYWLSANIIECVCYFAVPVFLMIPGATLIDYRKRYSTVEFFKRRAIKTLIPFVVWSLLAICCQLFITHNVPFEQLSVGSVLSAIFLNFSAIEIFWFFGPLFCIYLCMPLLSAVSEELRTKVFLYVVVVGFVINSLIPFGQLIFSWNFAWPYTLSIAAGLLIYPFIGYLIDKNEIKLSWRVCLYVLGFVSLLIHIIGTYYVSAEAGMVMQIYKGYTTPLCILYSTGVFVFIKYAHRRITNEKLLKPIGLLSPYTFAIYLLHWFVIKAIDHFALFNTFSLGYRLIAPFVVVALCVLITWVIRKIPVLRRILPS